MSANVQLSGPHTHVAQVGKPGTYWPAWEFDDGFVAVDLRLFAPTPAGAKVASQDKIFRPEELRKAGVPEETIAAAAKCEPIQGFVLMPRKRSGQ